MQVEKAGTPKRSCRAQCRWSSWQPARRSYGIGQDVGKAGFGGPFSATLALASLGEELVLGIWAEEVNLPQSTETLLLKYLPVR